MIKDIIDYYKHNPEGYWFKRKLYGWGWTPVKWQGWLILVIYIAILILIFNRLEQNLNSYRDVALNIILPFIAVSTILILICYKTGESPKWQWGPPKN